MGGSFLSSARLRCSRSAAARLAERLSVEIVRLAFAAAPSTISVNFFSCSGLESGQRALVTRRSRSVVVPASSSRSILALNQKAPKIGSFVPFGSSDIAARPVRTMPVSFSGCG